MNVYELKQHFKVKTHEQLGLRVGKTKGTITNWKNGGIPPEEQAVIQILTNNKVKADISPILAKIQNQLEPA